MDEWIRRTAVEVGALRDVSLSHHENLNVLHHALTIKNTIRCILNTSMEFFTCIKHIWLKVKRDLEPSKWFSVGRVEQHSKKRISADLKHHKARMCIDMLAFLKTPREISCSYKCALDGSTAVWQHGLMGNKVKILKLWLLDISRLFLFVWQKASSENTNNSWEWRQR